MSDYPVWGISKWRDFEQCPMMYHAKYIAKQWVDMPNEAMDRGRKMHKAFEDAVKYELQLPPELARYNDFVATVLVARTTGATVVPEHKFGVDICYGRVDYFRGNRLRVRCGLDLYVQNDRTALVIDYKSGKRKQEHEEDAVFYGSLVHITHGLLETNVQYLYIDYPESSFTKKIEDATAVASSWWQKFEYADKQVASGNIPVTPCNACSWCGYAACPNNKNRKLGK